MKIKSNTTNKDLPCRFGLYQRPSSEENGTNSSSGSCHGSHGSDRFLATSHHYHDKKRRKNIEEDVMEGGFHFLLMKASDRDRNVKVNLRWLCLI